MSGFLFRLGHASAGHPWRVIAAWIVVAAVGPHAQLVRGW